MNKTTEHSVTFINKCPEDKEWTAHIRLLNSWSAPDRYLREILQYARSGPFYPADMHVDLIEQAYQHKLKEARYMGSMDFSNWVLTHDESSFRQEKAWYKIKPKWITDYQITLMKGLKQVRTNMGLDPSAPVPQLASQEKKTDD